MSSTGGSEDAGRDLCLRLTSRRVPENAAQKDRTGLPFGVTVQPFKPLPHFPVDASALLDPAAEVARCARVHPVVGEPVAPTPANASISTTVAVGVPVA